ncbi:hypothetical protein HELRODRAFT_125141, partial [Helobdella robusta]|uniref:Uncharacterized protein n=1 Tax=Helobdella robusta TaxID=6412 RepID=T1EH45_HELRO
IYVGTLTKSVKLVKGFSLTTSILAVALVPVLYKNFQLDTSGGVMAAVAMGMNFFIFLTPVMLHFLTKRYVTSMYYNPNNNIFTATTINLFLQTKTHKFSSSSISIPKPSPFTSVIVNKKTPLLVDPTLFVDKDAMMLFYKCDESVDFEMGNMSEDVEKKNK